MTGVPGRTHPGTSETSKTFSGNYDTPVKKKKINMVKKTSRLLISPPARQRLGLDPKDILSGIHSAPNSSP